MSDTFTPKIELIDIWYTGSDNYRLINKGAGPDELQILSSDYEWVPESLHFVHGVLCNRIKELNRILTDLTLLV